MFWKLKHTISKSDVIDPKYTDDAVIVWPAHRFATNCFYEVRSIWRLFSCSLVTIDNILSNNDSLEYKYESGINISYELVSTFYPCLYHVTRDLLSKMITTAA